MITGEYKHYPVMAKEAVDVLNCSDGKLYIDATAGGGGYSELILQRIQPSGKLISFDVDIDAINATKERLKDYDNVTIVNDSYTNIKKYLEENNIKEITGGIVFDLGASTPQLTTPERGFSFMHDWELDMRFNRAGELTAKDIVNGYKEAELVRIFSEYGEERFSKRIAKKIVETRKLIKINTTKELVNIILEATPRIKSKIHPATRVFQALRIEVNDEINNIKNTLNEVLTLLSDNAILSVVTFHSIEDRTVKQIIKENSKERSEDPSGEKRIKPVLEVINKKPITASGEEIKANPPSRSAKLRAARRINKNQGRT